MAKIPPFHYSVFTSKALTLPGQSEGSIDEKPDASDLDETCPYKNDP